MPGRTTHSQACVLLSHSQVHIGASQEPASAEGTVLDPLQAPLEVHGHGGAGAGGRGGQGGCRDEVFVPHCHTVIDRKQHICESQLGMCR